MSALDERIEAVRRGERPDWMPTTDFWWAAEPVRTGALGTGREVRGEWVWRNRTMGVTIYQSVDITPEVARKFADFARHLPPRWLDRWRK